LTATAALSADRAVGFLVRFVSLAILAGATIGLGNVITTLFALHLGASSLQVGLISGSATFGMMLVTLPAGFIIARFGARRVYLAASLNCALLYLVVPWLTVWPALAAARGLIGASVPFRTISMNSTFLHRIRDLGTGKAGWYRAAQSTGMAVIGPWLGTALAARYSFFISYLCLSALFTGMAVWSQNFLPDAEHEEPVDAQPVSGFSRQILAMLKDLWVGESCLTEFISSATTSLFSSFIIVLAVRGFAWPITHAAALITTQGVTLIGALFLLGPVLQRLRIGYAYAGSLACATAALILIGTVRTLPLMMLGAILLAIGAALIHLINVLRLAESPLPKSKISSVLNLAGQSGSLVGSVAGGLISSVIGLQSLFLAWLPLLWATAAICLWRFRLTPSRQLRS
jgi:MFS family permease